MIFVDSNIPMYLVGAEHSNKHAARQQLERAVADGEVLVTDAEVMQEILHRYAAIGRRQAIEVAMTALLEVVDVVFPVDRADVERAARLVTDTGLSARDAIHVAVMRRHEVDRILTFDRGFDHVDGVARLHE